MQTSLGRLLLLLALAGLAAEAQESGTEVTGEQTRAAEIDQLEPQVSAEDLKRRIGVAQRSANVTE